MGGPIRVLHAVVNMNRGGAETLIMNLYRNIDRSKVQFDFLTSKPGVFDDEITELGGRIHRIPYITECGHRNYIKHLDQFFKENSQYKIVHAHMDKMSGFILRAAKKACIPTRIAHSHNTQSEGGIPAKIYKSYAGSQISKASTHYLACSRVAANWLFKSKASSSTILKNGIEINKFAFSQAIRDQVRADLRIEKNSVAIGHIGRFNHQKNHIFLIDIFNELLKAVPNAVLILVGDGPLRSTIEDKVKDLNIENKVQFLGIRSDVELLLQAFDLFVFPSLHEGLPVTLVEAQASGLPCIISDNISNEVDMDVNLIKYTSNTNMSEWIENIHEVQKLKINRNINFNNLSDKGYDIQHSSAWTKEYYLAISR
ncbi:glycosyltransferase family 1 protein [Bacillus sp. V2I10]|uniref:glycosyltransferase family 1 protein n=1 Tax=Bacillus sp. V2I10 TaxID=3042276 RepID=UPI002787A37A|nr:glycosyltransferase family 1 protein [Bacillus sp. V2I10]MDQ0859278.1 glycosyltransferase involved in cell wall biosynthesis [Bacillus sp. V2I10]